MEKKKRRKSNKRVILKKNNFQQIYEQVRKVAPLVLAILKKNAKSRDDDSILYLLVWKAQGMKEKDSCKKFKYRLIMGKYAFPDTIGRARRKIQERYVDLCGTIYHQRQMAEKEMKNQLSLW